MKAKLLTTPTVEALHAHLDRHIDDCDARGLLADELDEIGRHDLAEGYRALWRLRACPYNPGELCDEKPAT